MGTGSRDIPPIQKCFSTYQTMRTEHSD